MTEIVDLTETTAPKSDQLNADDLIAGPRTIRVTRVSLLGGDQPIAINFEGDNGKPYKPCKSMRRVMVRIWGPDGSKYAGHEMTLYCDPTVKFGGQEVGGIRISHMSGIDKPVTIALTATRASRKPFTVKPLERSAAPAAGGDEVVFAAALVEAKKGRDAFQAWWKGAGKSERDALRPRLKELEAATKEAETPDDDPFPTASDGADQPDAEPEAVTLTRLDGSTVEGMPIERARETLAVDLDAAETPAEKRELREKNAWAGDA